MKKAAAAILIVSMIIPLYACTAVSPVYASYGKYEITRSVYEYLIGSYKAEIAKEYGFDGEQYNESVWDKSIDGKQTLAQYVAEHVDSQINEMLVCAELFDQLGMSNDAELKEQMKSVVDEAVNKAVKSAGSLPELNGILGKYGMNKETLRQEMELEVKTSIVTNKLFGDGGDYAVSDGEREEYYQENYHLVKHILINNIERYVLDDKGRAKVDIYTGTYVTEKLTDEESAEKQKLAEDIYERCENGESFEALMKEYSEDASLGDDTKGIPVSADLYYLVDTAYLATALTLDTGEVKYVQTEGGIFIIKKYPLEAGLWKEEEYADLFAYMDANIISRKKSEIFKDKYSGIKKDAEYRDALNFADVAPLDSRILQSGE